MRNKLCNDINRNEIIIIILHKVNYIVTDITSFYSKETQFQKTRFKIKNEREIQ